jgi:mRNA export factor
LLLCCDVRPAGSWDKTLKYWDLRTPNPVFSFNLPDRCYAMDVKHPLLVVGTAERHLLVFNLQNPSTPYKQLVSPLKWQTRCVTAFPGVFSSAVQGLRGSAFTFYCLLSLFLQVSAFPASVSAA